VKVNGAKILIDTLIDNGVDTIFGYPGGAVLDIYDELYKRKDRIRHILVSHEQHAAHAADGYARSSGKAGVCIATSGPGATNLVTGIATAFVDSVPLIAITGNVCIPHLGKDSFQEVDIAGITMPVIKHNWIVDDVKNLPEIIKEAFIVALSGRPGPVLIDIPKDVIGAVCEYREERKEKREQITEKREERREKREERREKREERTVSELRLTRLLERTKRETYCDIDIKKVVELIIKSERPVIFAGGGVIRSDAGAEVKSLAELLNAPVAMSLMGMGAFAHDHPLCTGLTGMHGTAASNKAVQKCDLLIALGARFSERVTGNNEKFAKNAKIIHIDIDPAEINKNVSADAFIIGDLKEVLNRLLKKLPEKIITGWGSEIDEWKSIVPEAGNKKNSSGRQSLHPCYVIQETAKMSGENTVVVTDVGQHQIWTARYYPFKTMQKFISSGGMGTMGYGMGAAIGAKIANPAAHVVLFTGDGSFRMNSAEMATMVKYKLPVLIIIFNNRSLGMLRQWQNNMYKSRYHETDLENSGPDFVKLAAAYDVPGFRITDDESFMAALESAVKLLAKSKPVLIEALIDKDEKVV